MDGLEILGVSFLVVGIFLIGVIVGVFIAL